ncbi:MAG: DUF2799 domain-containing protein [Gammaproteobacteria bacterium]|nr:DUF2799 domain-containing protein [Gammaproteobacteria bacterium]
MTTPRPDPIFPRPPALRLWALLAVVVLAGCATLDESECRFADWHIIGLEDGAAGEPPSQVGSHRSACAEFGITPDLAAYRRGHREGLAQFCTPARGYEVGRRGRDYEGVCPPRLEGAFLDGYDLGRRVHEHQREVSRLGSAIRANERRMERVHEEVSSRERRLVGDGTSKDDRRTLLEEIKDLQRQLGELEAETLEYERRRAVARDRLADLTAVVPY